MKWVRFQDSDGIFYGIQDGDSIQKTNLSWEDILAGQAVTGGASVSLDSVKVLAPIASPSKIVAVGQNYMDHCREQNVAPPERPILFTKFTTSIIGNGDTIEYAQALTQQADYEVELAVVIGKEARNVSEEDALDYVFGYTVANDVSARDLQFGDKQWVRGKSLDTFCPMGPCILTADEVKDPQDLKLSTTLNGTVLQDSTTAEMIFGVRHLISFCSKAFTLLPGDVILTGTPDGVGVFRDPPIFLTDGDTVTCEVEGIGQLTNPVSVI
ncbi:MAG: fumarylacetoacetate hydrolase [Anaerolineaceae bacterium]|nr:fumarylacetoacetate hydrolase [Anaerolineaceae bacterium]